MEIVNDRVEELRRLMEDAGLEVTPEREKLLALGTRLSPKQTGALIGISRQQVVYLIEAEKIQAEKVHFGGREVWQIEPEAGLAYVRMKLNRKRDREARRPPLMPLPPPTEGLSPAILRMRQRLMDRNSGEQ